MCICCERSSASTARWQQAHAWPHVQFSFHQTGLSDLSVRANTPPSPSVFTHRENRKWFSPISNSLESELHFLLESIPFPLGVIWIPVPAFVPRAGPDALMASVMQELGKSVRGCSEVIHHLLSNRRWPPGEPPPIASPPTAWSRHAATSFCRMRSAKKFSLNDCLMCIFSLHARKVHITKKITLISQLFLLFSSGCTLRGN